MRISGRSEDQGTFELICALASHIGSSTTGDWKGLKFGHGVGGAFQVPSASVCFEYSCVCECFCESGLTLMYCTTNVRGSE